MNKKEELTLKDISKFLHKETEKAMDMAQSHSLIKTIKK